MGSILTAVAVLAAIGAVLGILLAVAARLLTVKTDERVEKIISLLPGANCGGCGYAGCAALAEAIAMGEASTSACKAGGPDCATAIAQVMGKAPEKAVRMRAQVMCSGVRGAAKLKYDYSGLEDCRAAIRSGGGDKVCQNGCIGHGTCAAACAFGAISVVNGVACVEYSKCVGCGMCASACPKGIIKMIPFEARYWVGCSSVDKGQLTRSYCEKGCISCKICEKNCPSGAITVYDGVAHIDYEKCTECGICYEKCPRHIIIKGN